MQIQNANSSGFRDRVNISDHNAELDSQQQPNFKSEPLNKKTKGDGLRKYL